MSAANKEKVGKVIYVAPIAIILIYIVVLVASEKPPTNKVTGSFLALAIFMSSLSSLLSGDIGIRGYGTVKKTERPILYWLMFVFQCLMGVIACVFAFNG